MRDRRITNGTLRKKGNCGYIVQWGYKGKSYWQYFHANDEDEAELKRTDIMTLVKASILDGTYYEKYGKDDEDIAHQTHNPTQIKIKDAWTLYLASPSRPDTQPQTLAQGGYLFGVFAEWIEKNHPNIALLSDVTKPIAEEFATYIGKGHAAGTFNKYRNNLTRTHRILLGETIDNPWKTIQRKKVTPNSKHTFTPEELAIIWAKATGDLKTVFLIGYHTGLRLGDACLLEWKEIDLTEKMIYRTIRKTGKKATIPILPPLLEHLLEIKKTNIGKYVCPRLAKDYLNGKGNRSDKLAIEIQSFLTSCGIRVHKEGTGLDVNGKKTGKRAVVEKGFHSLRHTWVTESMKSGMDRASMTSIVGWGNPEMEKIYSHVDPEHLRKGMERRLAKYSPNDAKPSPMPITAAPDALTDEQLQTLIAALLTELQRRQKVF